MQILILNISELMIFSFKQKHCPRLCNILPLQRAAPVYFHALTDRLLLNDFWTAPHPSTRPGWACPQGAKRGCLRPVMWIDMLFKNGSVWIIQSVILVSAVDGDVWLSRKHGPMILRVQLGPPEEEERRGEGETQHTRWIISAENGVKVNTVTPTQVNGF